MPGGRIDTRARRQSPHPSYTPSRQIYENVLLHGKQIHVYAPTNRTGEDFQHLGSRKAGMKQLRIGSIDHSRLGRPPHGIVERREIVPRIHVADVLAIGQFPRVDEILPVDRVVLLQETSLHGEGDFRDCKTHPEEESNPFGQFLAEHLQEVLIADAFHEWIFIAFEECFFGRDREEERLLHGLQQQLQHQLRPRVRVREVDDFLKPPCFHLAARREGESREAQTWKSTFGIVTRSVRLQFAQDAFASKKY
jgi:hypothetical protein